MKTQEIRKKSDRQLEVLLKDLRFAQIRASSEWSKDLVSKKEAGITIRGTANPGTKTKIQKDIRRNISRVLTIMKERENEE